VKKELLGRSYSCAVLPEFLQNLDHPIGQKSSRCQLARDPRQDHGTHQLLLEFRLPNSPKRKKKTKEKNFPPITKERWVSRNLGRAKEETGS